MEIEHLQRELREWQQRPGLWAEANLLARAEALDFVAFFTAALQMPRSVDGATVQLQREATDFAQRLRAENNAIGEQLRVAVQSGHQRGAALRTYLDRFTNYGSATCDGVYTNYDGLDVLVDGLFALQDGPATTVQQEAEMVHCEETPARAILDLIDHVDWRPDDCFYDIGAGLGQVAMLVHLLTGVEARGVEFEPAFVRFANQQAKALNLSAVHFIHADARAVDYAHGTVFFLFTPFRGQMLRQVLERLQRIAHQRPIQICTFGSCTPRVAEQSWLRPCHGNPQHEYQLVIFASEP